MREAEYVVFLHMRSDLLSVDLSGQLVRNEHHYDVAGLSGFLDVHDLQPCGFSLLGMCRARTQSNHHVASALVQVHRVGVAL